MPHRRCVGKLEGKLFRNYCYMHSEKVPIDRQDPDSPTETVFVGTLEEARQAVLVEAREERTGDIPDYPQGTELLNRKLWQLLSSELMARTQIRCRGNSMTTSKLFMRKHAWTSS